MTRKVEIDDEPDDTELTSSAPEIGSTYHKYQDQADTLISKQPPSTHLGPTQQGGREVASQIVLAWMYCTIVLCTTRNE